MIIKRNQRITTEDPNQLSYAKIKQLENTKKKTIAYHQTSVLYFSLLCYLTFYVRIKHLYNSLAKHRQKFPL